MEWKVHRKLTADVQLKHYYGSSDILNFRAGLGACPVADHRVSNFALAEQPSEADKVMVASHHLAVHATYAAGRPRFEKYPVTETC